MRYIQWIPVLALAVACSSDEAPQIETDAGYVVPSLATAGDACRPGWQENYYPCDDGFAAGESEIGECVPGYRVCSDRVWGECLNQSFPSTETCNRLDDDCDGDADEELKDSCGRCDAVATIRDCFGQDCERGFDVSSSEATCVDDCCDCILFEPGSDAAMLVTFDMCEGIVGCNGDESITSLRLLGQLEGLFFEVRAASSAEALAKESFLAVEAFIDTDGNGFIDASGGHNLLEVRVSLEAEARANGSLCRIEPEYYFEI